MKVFEIAGILYLRVTPVKSLFHSTMVHEVVNRGDIFAVRLEDATLTIIDGELAHKAKVLNVCVMPAPDDQELAKKKQQQQRTPTVTVAKMKKQIAEVLNEAQQRLDNL